MMSKADTHVHTYFSGTTNYKAFRFPESVTSPEEQVDDARKNGMSVVCITDHDEIEGGFRGVKYGKKFNDIDVVAGEEITSADGEIVGLWLNEKIKPGLSAEETIDIIKSQGGIAIAPHPFSFYVNCLKEKILDLDLDGIETINGGHIDEWTNSSAQKCFDEHPGKWAAIGASDAHSTWTSGYTWTEFPGSGENDLRKAILNKTTVACGVPAPVFSQTQWSIHVVTQGQKMILASVRGKLDQYDQDNPLVVKTRNLSPILKMAAMIGGFIYYCPPMPFIATWIGTNFLKKNAVKLKNAVRKTFDY